MFFLRLGDRAHGSLTAAYSSLRRYLRPQVTGKLDVPAAPTAPAAAYGSWCCAANRDYLPPGVMVEIWRSDPSWGFAEPAHL